MNGNQKMIRTTQNIVQTDVRSLQAALHFATQAVLRPYPLHCLQNRSDAKTSARSGNGQCGRRGFVCSLVCVSV